MRKKGLDVLCLEFKYFKTKSGDEVIATDFAVGLDSVPAGRVVSAARSNTTREAFLSKLTPVGRPFFERLLQFAQKNQLSITWGAKGFSMRTSVGGKLVSVLYGFPPGCFDRVESVRTVLAEILKNVAESQSIVEACQAELEGIDGFAHSGDGPELKYVFTKAMSQAEEERLFEILLSVVDQIKAHGLKE